MNNVFPEYENVGSSSHITNFAPCSPRTITNLMYILGKDGEETSSLSTNIDLSET